MLENLDGLISFFASHHAIRAESILKREGLATVLIPGPKELSPNCGVAVRFSYSERATVQQILGGNHVKIDSVHHYIPRTDVWERPKTSDLVRGNSDVS